MLNAVRRIPFLKLLAIVQLALLARRHLQGLSAAERRRMVELARRGRQLTPAEREELRELAAKLEPRAFAGAVADAFSPVPLPRWLTRARRR
jgi:ABC-type hemin transport system ATPase subunit